MGKNLDAAWGLQPWGPVLSTQLFCVQTSPTIHFFHGDVVQHGGSSLTTPIGWLPMVEDGDIVATGDQILGAIIGIFDEDMDPIAYIDVGRTGNSTIAGYLLVANHPDQLFVIQEDCDTIPIPATSSEMNVDMAIPALNQGTEATGLSLAEIDSDTAGDTATLMLKLRHAHPDDAIPGTATYHTRWIVSINAHAYGSLGGDTLGKVTIG